MELDPNTLAEMQRDGIFPSDDDDDNRRVSFPQVDDNAGGSGRLTAEQAAAAAEAAAEAAIAQFDFDADEGQRKPYAWEDTGAGSLESRSASGSSVGPQQQQAQTDELQAARDQIADLRRQQEVFKSNIRFDEDAYQRDVQAVEAASPAVVQHQLVDTSRAPPGLQEKGTADEPEQDDGMVHLLEEIEKDLQTLSDHPSPSPSRLLDSATSSPDENKFRRYGQAQGLSVAVQPDGHDVHLREDEISGPDAGYVASSRWGCHRHQTSRSERACVFCSFAQLLQRPLADATAGVQTASANRRADAANLRHAHSN